MKDETIYQGRVRWGQMHVLLEQIYCDQKLFTCYVFHNLIKIWRIFFILTTKARSMKETFRFYTITWTLGECWSMYLIDIVNLRVNNMGMPGELFLHGHFRLFLESVLKIIAKIDPVVWKKPLWIICQWFIAFEERKLSLEID